MPVQFSVIIPCYNAARWIEATLQSVLDQTVPQSEIEVFVVDDGSKDDSAKRVLAMPAKNVQLIQTANQGASMARNRGTAASSGEFVQYLDADDLLYPTALEVRRQALATHAADIVYGRYERLVEQENGTFEKGAVAGQKMEDVSLDPELAVFSSFWVPPVALMYRRRILKTIGSWNRTFRVIQDARFLQDAAHFNARFVYVPEVLAAYRVHRRGSLSKGNQMALERDILKNAFQTEKRWRQSGTLSPARTKYLAASHQRSAEFFFGNDPVRFCLAYNAHRRLRKPWHAGYADLCRVTQACLGAGPANAVLKPVQFGFRGFRFLMRRLKQTAKPAAQPVNRN